MVPPFISTVVTDPRSTQVPVKDPPLAAVNVPVFVMATLPATSNSSVGVLNPIPIRSVEESAKNKLAAVSPLITVSSVVRSVLIAIPAANVSESPTGQDPEDAEAHWVLLTLTASSIARTDNTRATVPVILEGWLIKAGMIKIQLSNRLHRLLLTQKPISNPYDDRQR